MGNQPSSEQLSGVEEEQGGSQVESENSSDVDQEETKSSLADILDTFEDSEDELNDLKFTQAIENDLGSLEPIVVDIVESKEKEHLNGHKTPSRDKTSSTGSPHEKKEDVG